MLYICCPSNESLLYTKLSDLSDEQIERKLSYCLDLLKLADVIQPGLSQFRGQILFELYAVTEHKGRRMFQKDPIVFYVSQIYF